MQETRGGAQSLTAWMVAGGGSRCAGRVLRYLLGDA